MDDYDYRQTEAEIDRQIKTTKPIPTPFIHRFNPEKEKVVQLRFNPCFKSEDSDGDFLHLNIHTNDSSQAITSHNIYVKYDRKKDTDVKIEQKIRNMLGRTVYDLAYTLGYQPESNYGVVELQLPYDTGNYTFFISAMKQALKIHPKFRLVRMINGKAYRDDRPWIQKLTGVSDYDDVPANPLESTSSMFSKKEEEEEEEVPKIKKVAVRPTNAAQRRLQYLKSQNLV